MVASETPQEFWCKVCLCNVGCGHQGEADVKRHCQGVAHVKLRKAMENTHSLDKFGFTKASDPIREQVSHISPDEILLILKFFKCVLISVSILVTFNPGIIAWSFIKHIPTWMFLWTSLNNVFKHSSSPRVNVQPCWVRYFCSTWSGLGITLLWKRNTSSLLHSKTFYYQFIIKHRSILNAILSAKLWVCVFLLIQVIKAETRMCMLLA